MLLALLFFTGLRHYFYWSTLVCIMCPLGFHMEKQAKKGASVRYAAKVFGQCRTHDVQSQASSIKEMVFSFQPSAALRGLKASTSQPGLTFQSSHGRLSVSVRSCRVSPTPPPPAGRGALGIKKKKTGLCGLKKKCHVVVSD